MIFLKYKGLYLTLAIASLILFLSLQPLGELNTRILVSDPFLHFIAYGVMVLPVSIVRVYPHFSVFLIAMTYGGVVELIQPFCGREADIMDFFANILGVILGILMAQVLIFIFKLHPPHMR